jgi:hypothetical protein
MMKKITTTITVFSLLLVFSMSVLAEGRRNLKSKSQTAKASPQTQAMQDVFVTELVGKPRPRTPAASSQTQAMQDVFVTEVVRHANVSVGGFGGGVDDDRRSSRARR